VRLDNVVQVLVALVVAGASWSLLDRSGDLTDRGDVRVDDACAGTEDWVLPNGDLVNFGNEALFASNTALRSCVVDAGTLGLRVRGTQAAGIGAQVVIALGTTNLWEGFVTDPIELELDVPHGGTMLIAFVNDRYEPPEDRNLWISDVVFTPR